jgi:hypothetical protein
MNIKQFNELLFESGIETSLHTEDYAERDTNETYVEIDGNFTKFYNFINKFSDDWKVTSQDGVRYLELPQYSTIDRWPNESCNTHIRTKDIERIEIYKEYDNSLYFDLYIGLKELMSNGSSDLKISITLGGLK